MRKSRRSLLLAGALALAGGLGVAAPARAQRGTYEDFPFQQGSLFYRPGGNPLSRRAYSTPRTAPAPSYYTAPRPSYYAPPRPSPAYVPQPGYAPYYPAPGGSYYYPQPQYVYPRGAYGGYW